MKVLHICESLQGGAGKAVMRLHEALLAMHVESRILTRRPGSNVLEVYTFNPAIPLKKQFVHKITEKLGITREKAAKFEAWWKRSKGDAKIETFTFPVTEFKVEAHPYIEWADIIHLHWITLFINWPSFFKAIKKPMAWTLHDTNPMNGGYHYLLEQDLPENSFMAPFNKELLKIKEESFSRFSNKIIFIAPSNWMLSNLKRSYFKTHKAVQIFYTIQPQVFKNRNRHNYREVFDIPQDKKCILIMLDGRMWKGMDLLQECFSKIQHEEIHLVILRSDQSLNFNSKTGITYLEAIRNDLLLALLYSSVDLFVTASLEDNLPNTVIESTCCGTPVVAFAIGGITDMIIPGENGYLCESINAQSLEKAIHKAMDHAWDHNRIMEDAHARFNREKVVKHHIEVYEELLG